jgi:hypothetical protein
MGFQRTWTLSAEEHRYNAIVGFRIRRAMQERGLLEVDLIRETGLSQGTVQKAKVGGGCSDFVKYKLATALDCSADDLMPVTATEEDLDHETALGPPVSRLRPPVEGKRQHCRVKPPAGPVVTDDIVKVGQVWTWMPKGTEWRTMRVAWLQLGPGPDKRVVGFDPKTGRRTTSLLSTFRKGKFGARLVTEEEVAA